MIKQENSSSYLFGGNAPYIEDLYEAYLENPGSVPENWRMYFDAMQHLPASDGSDSRDIAHSPVQASFAERARLGPICRVVASPDAELGRKRVSVQKLIAAYRNIGSRRADLDPLKRQERPALPDLEPSFYGFSDTDMDIVFNTSNTYFGSETMPLRELIGNLRETYCGTLGIEFMYITDQTGKRWWQAKFETIRAKPDFSPERKKHILERLTAAEGFERYLHTRFIGQKRFSLEGGDSFIPAMDEIIQRAGKAGVLEIVIGMAHRGRLNVLVNIMGKNPLDLFAEFEGKHAGDLPSGDVKYHQGFTSDIVTPGGPVNLSLAFNPSHLEIVNPVVEGAVKARQVRRSDRDGSQVLPILVHGDAAFAGQGVIMETLNLALTRGYGTGGTVHIVINNQIGFTTSDPRDSRSTTYCTDVVKMIEAPVLHVNGDDPEAVVLAAQMALDYRQAFKRDVVIDIICFRKLGHNEQDTPAMTQPLMYKNIDKHPGTRKLYADRLLSQGIIKANDAEAISKQFRKDLDEGRYSANPVLVNKTIFTAEPGPGRTETSETGVPLTELQRISEKITRIPENFRIHPLVEKVVNDRRRMGRGEHPLDWGMGEHLAFASLVAGGYPVRITGQDSGRGTFSHRHAVLHDQNREKWDSGIYIPLQNVTDNQAPFTVIDSVLSEEAVLGFEYGYSISAPDTLVIWEAQFGDFANGAQVLIDQFITSGEVKWGLASGLTLMLPHGYEGQGPEHSSARPERFLQLCAENNIQVCQPTTPAQIFHLLRRQMTAMALKPLVILTPKSLLRNKEAVSRLDELSEGHFRNIIGDPAADPKKITRLLACSGKIYYDLLNRRRENTMENAAVIRVEQLYPFPFEEFSAEIRRYPGLKEIVWCQDEPKNQGYWRFLQHYIMNAMIPGQQFGYAGRPASASTACGYAAMHALQQQALLDQAYGEFSVFYNK
ncbi:MAG: 2-oxoglutarate dehydrogenase E1 component [Chlorobium limicola]|uniref:2-oxoglutarate dehydrogenase E1 component n=1 Tax=Chlorobium limicola (strain DSM 245 / NBRC 103803 / 6330) TaxID=290315 RepID=B3ED12_CHLL2|nr:2-oxoglutarate dehydrogenase E1 component [Chlorobium limicola]ACD90437.1 2-oxoglutarate dehydrogenase, E1 subunit [Chlorobium limicola DSM 245]NTV07485.1 2-oxoglutarate dehydrogenase E1 component [Chlorobium limicola]